MQKLNTTVFLSLLLVAACSDIDSDGLLADVNASPVVADQTLTLDENSAKGTEVGTVAGSDADAGDTLVYTVTGGSGQTAFKVNASNGVISVADSAPLNFESNPSLQLDVQVSDNGSPALSATAIITIDLNDAPSTLNVTLKRTTNGIPHIQADDWASVGYGYGYAYAQDNSCVLMKEIVISNGQSQRYFGDDGDLAGDFVFALLGDEEEIQRDWIDGHSENVQRLLRGYVQGVNQYLAETGAGNLAEGEEGCRGTEWVRPISLLDMGKNLRKFTASTDQFADFIFAAQAPDDMTGAKPNKKTRSKRRAAKTQINEAEL